ncbi:MAG TPA: hypothetical protein VF606_12115 [Geminicoccaceae bacterium]
MAEKTVAVTLETIAHQMERMLEGMDALHRVTQRLLDRLERIERNVQAIADRLGAVPADEAEATRDPRTAALLERMEERLARVEQRLRN